MNFYKSVQSSSSGFLRPPFLILLAIWALLQAFLLWKFGVVTDFEAEKYIYQAGQLLAHGEFTSRNYWLYSTEILLISLAIKFHTGYLMVVIVHWIFSLWATYRFFKLAFLFLQNEVLAWIATILLLVNVFYQLYSTHLFTESLFYSFTVIFSSYLLEQRKWRISHAFLLVLFLAIIFVTRPTGVLFFLAAAFYLFMKLSHKMNIALRIGILLGSAIVFTILVNKMMHTGGSLDFMLPFIKENIICGVNTVNDSPIKTLKDGNSLEGLVFYIFHNGSQFIRLAWLKTIAFFGLMRTYFSLPHNLFLTALFYPLYALSILGIAKNFRHRRGQMLYFITIILLFWMTTVLTCDDWHNRFILTVYPYFILLGLSFFASASSSSRKR